MIFNSVSLNEFSGIFDTFSKDWMLIAVDRDKKENAMTASWGGFGFMWSVPAAYIFIRPHRYTMECLNETDTFTASFYKEEYRNSLNICGKKSGRDTNKIDEAELTPVRDKNGFVYFEQAEFVLCLKKLYVQQLDPSCAVDTTIFEKNYPNKDYHNMIIAQVVDCLKKHQPI